MLDFNPNWLAHCTEIKDLAKSLFQKSTIHLDSAALLLITDGQTTLSINGHNEHIVFGHLLNQNSDDKSTPLLQNCIFQYRYNL
ncbi:hypothetical protein [Lysinibacillus sp. ZYM-1]|uniref:hypothetical protein n=1 Tax=Lysinibacillus sp. ZYM-1 TaxID=1681184 RepID=UPI0006CE9B18|nr:hypothetical protein [Lysinibacillus sp. ZYM-1]KPN94281.1 hypothetical protein AO843_23485 [Lysinibacillus sp. ZYM-1]